MHRCAFWIAEDKDEMKVTLRGELDGLQAFEQIHDQISLVNGIERIVIDLSETSQVKPIELHYLLTDLAVDPCFSNIEICVSGLRFTHMSADCPYTHGRRQRAQAEYQSFERIRM
jgi:hypothetical protein